MHLLQTLEHFYLKELPYFLAGVETLDSVLARELDLVCFLLYSLGSLPSSGGPRD